MRKLNIARKPKIALTIAMAGPLALALSACNFMGGTDKGAQDTTAARNAGDAPAAAPAAPAAAPTTAAPTGAANGGKGGAAPAAAPAPVSAPAPAAVTDSKPSTTTTAANQCTDQQDRHVSVVNATSTTLSYLYGSNVNRSDWEEDVLGSDVLAPGASVNVNWDDGTCMCRFDLKAKFSDGTETIRRDFNVCTESTWRIVE